MYMYMYMCMYMYNDNDNDFSTTRTMRTALAAARRLTASRAPSHAPVAGRQCLRPDGGRAPIGGEAMQLVRLMLQVMPSERATITDLCTASVGCGGRRLAPATGGGARAVRQRLRRRRRCGRLRLDSPRPFWGRSAHHRAHFGPLRSARSLRLRARPVDGAAGRDAPLDRDADGRTCRLPVVAFGRVAARPAAPAPLTRVRARRRRHPCALRLHAICGRPEWQRKSCGRQLLGLAGGGWRLEMGGGDSLRCTHPC